MRRSLRKQFRRRQRPVGRSWRLDETYVKIKGKSAYLYRAVDKEGHTIDFLLTPTRDRDAAEAFLRKAIRTQGLPEKITIDKSGSNTAAITHYNKTHKTAIVIRHSKYLNNIVEQDHRAVKRLTRPMLGLQVVLGGALYDRRHRSHARDSQGTAGDSGDTRPKRRQSSSMPWLRR